MPLGKAPSCWPPWTLSRSTSWWDTPSSMRQTRIRLGHQLIEACWHSLLDLFGYQPPIDPATKVVVNFYPRQNFIASRAQLRRHSHDTYLQAFARLVENGTCLEPTTQQCLEPPANSSANCVMRDSPLYNKEMVAKGVEHLMHVIFGGLPFDATAYAGVPANSSCMGFVSRKFDHRASRECV